MNREQAHAILDACEEVQSFAQLTDQAAGRLAAIGALLAPGYIDEDVARAGRLACQVSGALTAVSLRLCQLEDDEP